MSVRGTRTVYRERSVERDYEEEPRRTYTTVRRYQVPESITRTIYKDDEEEETKDKIVIKRTTREDPPPSSPSVVSRKSRRDRNDDYKLKVTETKYDSRDTSSRDEREVDTYRYTRTERSADPPRRDVHYRVIERDTDYDQPRSRSEFKYVERDTEVVRAPSPPSPERVREFRFEREREYSPERERPYDIERYSKSTEYFAQPAPAPQPIIIRESAPAPPIIIREERREPQKIIIREERREPQYEFIERKEAVEETRDESRSLVKSAKSEAPATVAAPEPSPSPQPAPQQQPEEDYFYERRVIERRRRSDSYDRKTEKEIRPRDSASNYSSDDSYEYIRKERTYEDDDKHHHKRHLAEGAIAGIGAAEIIRHHRKSKGEATAGRGRSALGGAAVGAVGAEVISRVRSMSRRRRFSDSRSRSGERERHHRRKHRSRSRSKENGNQLTRNQTLGGLAAVAAVGALAGYALKNRGNKETVIVNEGGRHHRRSRSRRRRASVDSYEDYGGSPNSEHRDPNHRNQRIAQAGLASAAAAGIWERVRSKSRGGKERSKSRIRQGVPIAAAGLGGAALAGLYEKNKANKEAKKDAIIEDELHRGRRRSSRSRSRGRFVPAPYSRDDRGDESDSAAMIAYGDAPIYPEDRNYNDDDPGVYRRRGGSDTSSPDTRHRKGSRSRSRGRNLAEIGAAAGAAGIAAHEIGKRRERSRVARERSRERNQQQNDPYYDNGYNRDHQYSPPPVGNNGYIQDQQHNNLYGQQQAYPSSNYFPPPPTGENAAHDPAYAHQTAYPAYNPADYANQSAQQYPYDASRGAYGESDAALGQPHPNDTYAGDQRYGGQDHGRSRGRQDPENVSAPTELDRERESQESNGLTSPRPRSSSRVRFDLQSNTAHSPEAGRRKDDAKRSDPSDARFSDDETGGDTKHRHRRRKGKDRERDSRRRSHHEKRDHDNDSDDTEELPERFDKNGNPRDEDPLSQKINDLLGGKGGGGDIFKDLLGGLMKGSDGSDDGRTSRRRSRR